MTTTPEETGARWSAGATAADGTPRQMAADLEPEAGAAGTEVRYYIGVTDMGRIAIKAGPGTFRAPAAPTALGRDGGGATVYPVGVEVYDEWIADPDGLDDDGDDLGEEWDDPDD